MQNREPEATAAPGPDTTFSLAPGVRFEPLGDGSGVLYSKELEESLSLNHTGALLCSFADGQHTVSHVVQEMRHVFPEGDVDESALIAFLQGLESRRFLRWG
jgi:hypothetical protein